MADTVTMPKLGFDMAEGTLVRWVKHEGETVNKGEVLAEIETDKATVEVESTFSGVVARLLVEQGNAVPVGAPIAIIAAPGEDVSSLPVQGQPASAPEVIEEKEVKQAAPLTDPTDAPKQPVPATGRVMASPLARRVAQDSGLDLGIVRGSGIGGRITRKDVEEALVGGVSPVEKPTKPAEVPAPVEGAKTVAAPQALFTAEGVPNDQSVPLDKLRLAIGRRLVESKQQIPHFYLTHEYDMEGVLKLRAELNDLLPEESKLSINDFIVKAAALTLRQFPAINASLNGTQIVRHGHINVGVAVSVPGGLMTVVIHDADQKPLRVISSEVKEMVARARSGKVRTDDIEGSTFSLSNLGMYDVKHFVAIINPPEAAILAISSAQQVPVVKDGEVRVGTRMQATLSADHRVTDGVEAAQFMQALAQYLEQPLRLLV